MPDATEEYSSSDEEGPYQLRDLGAAQRSESVGSQSKKDGPFLVPNENVLTPRRKKLQTFYIESSTTSPLSSSSSSSKRPRTKKSLSSVDEPIELIEMEPRYLYRSKIVLIILYLVQNVLTTEIEAKPKVSVAKKAKKFQTKKFQIKKFQAKYKPRRFSRKSTTLEAS